MNSIEDLIYPIDLTTFIKDYYEKEVMFLQNRSPDYYDNLITFQDIDDFLQRDSFPYQCLILAKNKISNHGNWSTFHPSNILPEIRWEKLFQEIENGNSIVFNQLNKYIPKLSRFVENLKFSLQCHIGFNVYITPPFSQAYDRHIDAHDVLILQICGSKEWRLFDTPIPLPDETQHRILKVDKSHLPLKEFHLKEGDLLYIPRGVIHEASATDKISMHVTLSLFPERNLDIISHIYEEAIKDVFFRNTLNALTIPSDIEGHEAILKTKLQKLIAEFSLKKYLAQQNISFLEKRLKIRKANRLKDNLLLPQLNEQTIIKVPEEVNFKITYQLPFIKIIFNGDATTFPIILKNFILAALSKTPYSIENMGTNLPLKNRLSIIQNLVSKGLLTIVKI